MIDSLRRGLQYAIEFLDIIPHSAKDDPDIATVSQMLVAYDALAPDWNEAPEWAKWYAIDANGSAAWYKQQPKYDEFCDKWLFGSGSYLHEYHWAGEKDDIAIPLGIDWRLLVWQRPVQEVQNG